MKRAWRRDSLHAKPRSFVFVIIACEKVIAQSVSEKKMGTCLLFLGKIYEACARLVLCVLRVATATTAAAVVAAAETPRALIWLQGKTIPPKQSPICLFSFFSSSLSDSF